MQPGGCQFEVVEDWRGRLSVAWRLSACLEVKRASCMSRWVGSGASCTHSGRARRVFTLSLSVKPSTPSGFDTQAVLVIDSQQASV